MYYNARDWEKLAEDDAEVKAFLRFLKTKQPEDELTEDIMTEVENRFRRNYMNLSLKIMETEWQGIEKGRKEAQKELAEAQAQLAADQARIAERDTEIVRLKKLLAEHNIPA